LTQRHNHPVECIRGASVISKHPRRPTSLMTFEKVFSQPCHRCLNEFSVYSVLSVGFKNFKRTRVFRFPSLFVHHL